MGGSVGFSRLFLSLVPRVRPIFCVKRRTMGVGQRACWTLTYL